MAMRPRAQRVLPSLPLRTRQAISRRWEQAREHKFSNGKETNLKAWLYLSLEFICDRWMIRLKASADVTADIRTCSVTSLCASFVLVRLSLPSREISFMAATSVTLSSTSLSPRASKDMLGHGSPRTCRRAI